MSAFRNLPINPHFYSHVRAQRADGSSLCCNRHERCSNNSIATTCRAELVKEMAVTIPETNIQVLAPVNKLDFFDTQSVRLSQPISPLGAWRIVMSRPMPIMRFAFKVRDAISSMFGVRKIGGFSGIVPTSVKVGQMLDFFLIEHVSQDVLTLTERDRHLDVMTCISSSGNVLTVTSSVRTHNTFGRIYMIPVAPAHKIIVRKKLKQIAQSVG